MPGTLNPGGFGAMTAILDVRSRWRRKPGTLNGLTGDCRHSYRQDGKSGRNNGLEGRAVRDGIQPDGGIRVDTMVEHANHAHWESGYRCRPITM